MTYTTENKRSSEEASIRRSVFTQVALVTMSARPALVVTGGVDGPKVSEHFVETVSLIVEGILSACTEFGDK